MRKSFFHMMPLTSVFLFCLFTSSSVGLSCLLFPLNFRQPPPTYFIANKILYQSKRVACIKNRHEWKKTRPLYPRKYIKCPESFQSYQMHRTNFKICSQNNKTAMDFLNYFRLLLLWIEQTTLSCHVKQTHFLFTDVNQMIWENLSYLNCQITLAKITTHLSHGTRIRRLLFHKHLPNRHHILYLHWLAYQMSMRRNNNTFLVFWNCLPTKKMTRRS